MCTFCLVQNNLYCTQKNDIALSIALCNIIFPCAIKMILHSTKCNITITFFLISHTLKRRILRGVMGALRVFQWGYLLYTWSSSKISGGCSGISSAFYYDRSQNWMRLQGLQYGYQNSLTVWETAKGFQKNSEMSCPMLICHNLK